MTGLELEALETDLRERAKSYGDHLDDIQRLKKDLANIVAHLRATEEDAELDAATLAIIYDREPSRGATARRVSFEEAWKAWGSDYGPEALRQVRLGWDLHGGILSAPGAGGVGHAKVTAERLQSAYEEADKLRADLSTRDAEIERLRGTLDDWNHRISILTSERAEARIAAATNLRLQGEFSEVCRDSSKTIDELRSTLAARDTEIESLRAQKGELEILVAEGMRETYEAIKVAVAEEREACAMVCGTLADFAANLVVTNEVTHAKRTGGVHALQDAVTRIRARTKTE